MQRPAYPTWKEFFELLPKQLYHNLLHVTVWHEHELPFMIQRHEKCTAITPSCTQDILEPPNTWAVCGEAMSCRRMMQSVSWHRYLFLIMVRCFQTVWQYILQLLCNSKVRCLHSMLPGFIMGVKWYSQSCCLSQSRSEIHHRQYGRVANVLPILKCDAPFMSISRCGTYSNKPCVVQNPVQFHWYSQYTYSLPKTESKPPNICPYAQYSLPMQCSLD